MSLFSYFKKQAKDRLVTEKEGEQLARRLKAYKFLECSALTRVHYVIDLSEIPYVFFSKIFFKKSKLIYTEKNTD